MDSFNTHADSTTARRAPSSSPVTTRLAAHSEAPATHGAERTQIPKLKTESQADVGSEHIASGAPRTVLPQPSSIRASVKKYFERTNFPMSAGSKHNPIDIVETDTPPLPTLGGPTRTKGRSLGERSSKPIKALREAASNGDIEAALKLGWAVERLTEMHNRNKAKRGIFVALDTPIDDAKLIARIEERKHNAREATKRRSDKLKARAAAGDIEAAKKLHLGKKTMDALFPQAEPDSPTSPSIELDGTGSSRELSPTEPRDFDADHVRSGSSRSNTTTHPNASAYGPSDRKRMRETHAGTGQAVQLPLYHWNVTKSNAPLPAQLDLAAYSEGSTAWARTFTAPLHHAFEAETQLHAALLEAKRHAAVATGRVAELEALLKPHVDARQRVNLAMYEAMIKSSRSTSDSTSGGARSTSSSDRSWTFVHENGQDDNIDSE